MPRRVYRPHAGRLVELREARNLTTEDVAAATGLFATTIQDYEQGERVLRFQYNQLAELADFYGVEVHYLVEQVPNAELDRAAAPTRRTTYRPNGKLIATLRESRGLKPKDLGLAVAVDGRTISDYEDGERTDRFQYNQLRAIADFFGVEVDTLIEQVPDDQLGVLPQRASFRRGAGA